MFLSLKYNNSIYFLHTSPIVKKFKQRFILDNCLFGSLKLIKNTDPNKYKYSVYGIGFDSRSDFSLPDGTMG